MEKTEASINITGFISYSSAYFRQVLKPLNQVLSSIADQEVGQQFDPDNLNYEGSYPIEEFEVRILEPEKSGGPWKTRASIPMQSSENALTVRMVTLFVSLILFLFFLFLLFVFNIEYKLSKKDFKLNFCSL